MKKMLLLGALLAVASAVYAFPTIYGWTGGLEVPTAAVQTGWALAVENSTQDNPTIPSTFLLAGVIPNLEVGANFAKPEVGAKDWGINAKYVLPFELFGGKTAAGVSYIKMDAGDASDKITDLYLAGTFPVMGCDLTVAADFFEEKETGFETVKKLSPQVALAKGFENGASVGVEGVFNVGNDDYANLYTIFPLNEQMKARIAWAGINAETETLLAVEYAFGAAE